jgi:hypothetical protein
MKRITPSPQSLEIARGGAFESLRCDDPKTSREAAWRAVERGDFSPDPSYGAGIDEYQFSGRDCGRLLPDPTRPGIFLK